MTVNQILHDLRVSRAGPRCLLLVLLLGSISALQAAPVTGLYQAEVPAAGRAAEQRNQAIRDAFGRVLVKVTGNRNIAAREELREGVANAARYVQQYSYRGGDASQTGAAAGIPAELRPRSVRASRFRTARSGRAQASMAPSVAGRPAA